jgi:FSR family fosmidomycin resistance protein-like MFS transporter
MSAAATTANSLGRDLRVMSLVGMAHGFSHFFQLVIPPLLFLIKDDLGVSYTALGAMVTVVYTTSGFAQAAAGFLVDRFGAARILLAGLALFAGAIMLAGLAPNFYVLVAITALAGVGNSVFHPADFAILNARVSPGRMGRAFGAHGICGNLGWALASLISPLLAYQIGWRATLMTLGALGLLVALFLAGQARHLSTQASVQASAPATAPRSMLGESIRALFNRAILMCFAYFALIAIALIGIQAMGADTLTKIYEIPHQQAALAVTVFLFGTAAGVLVGGWLADNTTQHAWVAGTGMGVGGALILLVATAWLNPVSMIGVMALTGFCLGCTNPSRDMLVRSATPPGSTGKVFGFVYSGLDVGSAMAPLAIGVMLDHGDAKLVFASMAVLMVLTIGTIIGVRAQANPARMAAPAE